MATITRFSKQPPQTVRLRLWAEAASAERLEGQEIQKTFEAFVLWLERQAEPGQLEVEIDGRWWMVQEDFPAFHWSGTGFDKAPPRLIPKMLPLDDPRVQGVLQYEAWTSIKRHHDFFYKGIAASSSMAVETAKALD